MNEREIQEALGAYALDAVDEAERAEIELYLEQDPRARDEVQQHREVATMLAYSGSTAPDGLWDRIAAELEGTAPVLRLDTARRRRWPTRVGALVAAAAVAAIAILSTKVVQLNDRVDRNESALAQPLLTAARRAMRDPTARLATLTTADGSMSLTAVVTSDGAGYLVSNKIPTADASHTYQLWGVTKTETISLGVLGREPSVIAFHVNGSLDAVAITLEQGQGVAVTKQKPLAVGTLA